jgi:hypothetical protein
MELQSKRWISSKTTFWKYSTTTIQLAPVNYTSPKSGRPNKFVSMGLFLTRKTVGLCYERNNFNQPIVLQSKPIEDYGHV